MIHPCRIRIVVRGLWYLRRREKSYNTATTFEDLDMHQRLSSGTSMTCSTLNPNNEHLDCDIHNASTTTASTTDKLTVESSCVHTQLIRLH